MLEIVHIAGIVMVVGAAFMFDLRLLGFSKHLSVTSLAIHLLPWSKKGLFLIVPSGLLLFITNAKTLGVDPTFWIKMALLIFAGINATVFNRYVFRDGDEAISSRTATKIVAVISTLLWISVIACGRLLAY